MNLSLFFIEQADQFIVLLDGLERLDKNGLSTGAGAMNYALDAPLLLDLHRDYETLAANGDQFVLNGAAFGEPPQVAAQRFLNLATLFFHLAADAREIGRSFVVQSAVGENLVAETAQELGEIDNAGRKLGHGGPSHFHRRRWVQGNLPPFRGAFDERNHITNFGGLKRRPRDPRFLQ